MDNLEEKAESFLHLTHPSQHHGGNATLTNPPPTTSTATANPSQPTHPSPRPSTDAPTTHSHGVNVESAQNIFTNLQRELSRRSNHTTRSAHSATFSPDHKSGAIIDIEKASPHSTTTTASLSDHSKDDSKDDAERKPFDLAEVLRGNKQLEDEAGIKAKQIGVVWRNLTVRGVGGVKVYVPVFPDAFTGFFGWPFRLLFGVLVWLGGIVAGWWRRLSAGGREGRGDARSGSDAGMQGGKRDVPRAPKKNEVEILSGFRGVAKPGEMVLVLGKPGAGCTTFLKLIANQRFGYTSIDGTVEYGPFEAGEFEKRYRGEAVYCMEDDVHFPTLSVGQTLGFALETKVPGVRPGGVEAGEFKEKVLEMLLRMFNIEHTRNTIVGNPFVRGISGGERKRVSIAEMMITGAAVCAHDNSTRGLDASTASDYARSLRVMTNIYRTTTFVSLYQASENIYDQFDKVLVIDAGRQVFYGPTKEARAYFEGLGFLPRPRVTTPDYLTGCTDAFEREYMPDRPDAPQTTEELVAAFEASTFARRLDDEMQEWSKVVNEEKHVYEDFKAAVLQGKRHASKNSVYSIPFHHQIWAIMKRQFTLKWQDTFSLCVSYATSIIIAIVTGTVWLQIPKTSAGAFTRGGVLFIALLFNCFQAFGELASTMLNRPIVNKHRAYTFHRPSALWIAQIMVDLLFASVQICLFSILVYFMCGLALSAGAFFTFVLVIITGYLTMTLLFRTIGCLCPDFDSAIKFAATLITLLILTTGYMIQYQSQQFWLRWLFYINPLGLGFAALMVNEFSRIDLTCSAPYLIPYGEGYDNLENQVCTLYGSHAGSNAVTGNAYTEAAFSYYPDQLWRNYGIIIALLVAFLVSNVWLGEVIKWGAGGKTITFFAKENDERKKLNQTLMENRKNRTRAHDKEAEVDAGITIESKAVLTWEELCYDVPVPNGQLRLLRDVYGYVNPGQLTALMGASGAGKTTLLDVLASRKNIGVISGDKLIDGMPPGTGFQRGTSYAEQLDVHESTQTVREALRFSAVLRQPYTTPEAEKFAYVEEIIALLEMEDIADAIIGSPEAGLAVEQRKRVTIGCELAAKPELLLFLDEPTSGLDSQSAFNIVRFLRKLAAAGQAILCTIHQPNASLFENFDRLLLLQKGGETVYFGDIGKDASVLTNYFRKHGADCPANANPAEWMLDAIGSGNAPRIGNKDWGELWRESDELAEVKQEIIRIKEQRISEVGSQPVVEQKEYATPLWHQIKTVQARTHKAFWRSPNYGFTRLFNHVIIALLTGLAFLQLDDSRTSLQYRVFVIFQYTVMPALILAQVEPKYDLSRMIYYREAASKTYKQLPFALSMVIAEVPYSILCAVGFFVPIYYVTGFNYDTTRAGFTFFVVMITELFSVTLAQMISALTPSTFIAVLFNPFVIIIFSLFCGVTIPKEQIPGFWRSWLYELDPFTRLVASLTANELYEQPVVCTSTELQRFPAPSGMNCGDYMAPFFSRGGPGYIVDNATSSCAYCAYSVGNQFYEPLGISYANKWRDFGIFTAFIGSNLILLFLGSRYFNFNKR